ncbi:hypothetical protein HK405_005353, partial [Cladochytrium tenue]
ASTNTTSLAEMLPHHAAAAGAGPDPLRRLHRRRAPASVPDIAVNPDAAATWTVPLPNDAAVGKVSSLDVQPPDQPSAVSPRTITSVATVAATGTDRAVRLTLVRTATGAGAGKRASTAPAQPRRFHSVKDSLYVVPSDGIEKNRQKLLVGIPS